MIEIWKDIPGYNGRYQISNMGSVWSFYKNKPLALTSRDSGYVVVNLHNKRKQKTYRAHVLVAKVFISPRPEGMVINHKNEIRHDNRVENLEYCSYSYNAKYAWLVMGRPVVRTNTKLTEDEVREIKKLLLSKTMKQKDIAKKFNIHRSTITMIKNGTIWKHVKLNDSCREQEQPKGVCSEFRLKNLKI